MTRRDIRPRAHCMECGRLIIVPAEIVLEGIECGQSTWSGRNGEGGLACDDCCNDPRERADLICVRIRDRDEGREMVRHAYEEWDRMRFALVNQEFRGVAYDQSIVDDPASPELAAAFAGLWVD